MSTRNFTIIQIIEANKVVPLDLKWCDMIRYCQEHPYHICEMSVEIREGKPYNAQRVRESIKF